MPKEQSEKPHLKSDNLCISEVTLDEFEAAKAHIKELEASFKARVANGLGIRVEELNESFLAMVDVGADQSACKGPATIQEQWDCAAHMLAGMINILECFEGNWGGNPYPWDEWNRASPLWLSAIRPFPNCSVGFYQGLLDAKQYGVLTWDRLNYEEYHGDCYAVTLTSKDYAWAYPLRIEGFSIVYLWDKNTRK